MKLFQVAVDVNGKFDLLSFLEGLYLPNELTDQGRWPKATKDAVFKILRAVERSEDCPKSVTEWDQIAQAWCHTAGCRPRENMTAEEQREALNAR